MLNRHPPLPTPINTIESDNSNQPNQPHPQANLLGFSNQLDRFVFAYKRAVSAMTVTSLTSAMAFFATSISPIPAVSAFGTTMGTMVVIDFLLVITWFPASVLVYERYFCPTGGCRCCQPEKKCRVVFPCCSPLNAEKGGDLGAVENFFHTTYTDFLDKRNNRRAILGSTFVFVLVALSVSLSTLEVTGDFPANFDPERECAGTIMISLYFGTCFTAVL